MDQPAQAIQQHGPVRRIDQVEQRLSAQRPALEHAMRGGIGRQHAAVGVEGDDALGALVDHAAQAGTVGFGLLVHGANDLRRPVYPALHLAQGHGQHQRAQRARQQYQQRLGPQQVQVGILVQRQHPQPLPHLDHVAPFQCRPAQRVQPWPCHQTAIGAAPALEQDDLRLPAATFCRPDVAELHLVGQGDPLGHHVGDQPTQIDGHVDLTQEPLATQRDRARFALAAGLPVDRYPDVDALEAFGQPIRRCQRADIVVACQFDPPGAVGIDRRIGLRAAVTRLAVARQEPTASGIPDIQVHGDHLRQVLPHLEDVVMGLELGLRHVLAGQEQALETEGHIDQTLHVAVEQQLPGLPERSEARLRILCQATRHHAPGHQRDHAPQRDQPATEPPADPGITGYAVPVLSGCSVGQERPRPSPSRYRDIGSACET